MTTSMTKATTSTMERGERAGRPLLTRSGAQLLAERSADIRYRRLAELAPLLVEHERDERHVAEFEQVLAEADQWDAFLASADILVIDAAAFDGRIGLGTRVEVRLIDGSTAWVHPVHPFEAFLDDERISVTSPLGAALQGAHERAFGAHGDGSRLGDQWRDERAYCVVGGARLDPHLGEWTRVLEEPVQRLGDIRWLLALGQVAIDIKAEGDRALQYMRENKMRGIVLACRPYHIDPEINHIQTDLAHYQRVLRFTLLEKPFSIEEGELTPTQKVRRKVIEERYGHLIDNMYEGIS